MADPLSCLFVVGTVAFFASDPIKKRCRAYKDVRSQYETLVFRRELSSEEREYKKDMGHYDFTKKKFYDLYNGEDVMLSGSLMFLNWHDNCDSVDLVTVDGCCAVRSLRHAHSFG